MDQPSTKKLYRSRNDKILAGVCGGLGEYFKMDSLIFRIIFLVLLFAGGSGFWLYVILAIIIPQEGTVNHPGAAGVRDHANDFVAEVRQSAQQWAREVRGHYQDHRPHHGGAVRLWFGLLIIAIGVLALINRLFPQYWIRWDLFWPVAIIILGLMLLSGTTRNRGQ